jgi:hypothetical protein
MRIVLTRLNTVFSRQDDSGDYIKPTIYIYGKRFIWLNN